MNIEVKKHGKGHYRADCLDLPGSPPVGLGKTQAMALAHLMFYIVVNKSFSIPTDEIFVNGKKWEIPESYKRE